MSGACVGSGGCLPLARVPAAEDRENLGYTPPHTPAREGEVLRLQRYIASAHVTGLGASESRALWWGSGASLPRHPFGATFRALHSPPLFFEAAVGRRQAARVGAAH